MENISNFFYYHHEVQIYPYCTFQIVIVFSEIPIIHVIGTSHYTLVWYLTLVIGSRGIAAVKCAVERYSMRNRPWASDRHVSHLLCLGKWGKSGILSNRIFSHIFNRNGTPLYRLVLAYSYYLEIKNLFMVVNFAVFPNNFQLIPILVFSTKLFWYLLFRILVLTLERVHSPFRITGIFYDTTEGGGARIPYSCCITLTQTRNKNTKTQYLRL